MGLDRLFKFIGFTVYSSIVLLFTNYYLGYQTMRCKYMLDNEKKHKEKG